MKIIAAVVLAALYSVAGAADVAKPPPPVIMIKVKPVAPQRLLIRRPQRVLVDPDLAQDWDMIEYTDWDWHLGRARPRLQADSTEWEWDSDHVSDQVQARLTLARARAMARYPGFFIP